MLTISLASDNKLALTDEHKHSVFITLDVNGLRLLKSLLVLKQDNPQAKLGETSRPTQTMVEEFLRNKKLQKLVEEKQQADDLATLF